MNEIHDNNVIYLSQGALTQEYAYWHPTWISQGQIEVSYFYNNERKLIIQII